MSERFTDRARRVVVQAQEESRQLNHSYIGPEHILLGLIAEGHGVAVEVLRVLGAPPELTQARVLELAPPAGAEPG
jgi:ATP-dependent Clp protease ATP-binding subunit ClpC